MSSVNELLVSLGLKDWEMFYDYLSAYGVHITLCTILSAVTVYRREISCNRSYRKEEDEDEGTGSNNNNNNNNNNNKNNNNNLADNNNGNDNSMTLFNDDDDDDDEEKELMTEQLLDGAGMYYSGKPILNFAALLWLGLECYDYSENDENNNDNGNGNAENEKEESSSSSSSSTTTSLMNDLTPEDLLDRVGNYASPPEAIMATIALFMLWKKSKLSSSSSSSSSPSSFRNYKNIGCDPFMKGIPPDVHVQIASFLHPRDVVTLSCVSKAYHTITDETNNTTSVAIWKTLWHRDYSWIVYQWTIGKQALLRSNCTQWSYSKDFYFLFGQSYLDYVIAGHNTLTNCLVGIHSNIYDITPFLFSHPGTYIIIRSNKTKQSHHYDV
jgi:cytochrome b involved in lipid metabolism